MKTLYIVRHAKASWNTSIRSDGERPLSPFGLQEAAQIGQRLAKREVKPALIIASPAQRALQTARLIADAIGYPTRRIDLEDRLYATGLGDVLQVLKALAEALPEVMICGHNPVLTDLAEYLAATTIGGLPTGGVYAVRLDIYSWYNLEPGSGEGWFYEYPT